MNAIRLPSAAIVALVMFAAGPASGQTPTPPCQAWFAAGAGAAEEPQDTAMALTEPDCYAWRLFVAVNWPADWTQRRSDPAKPFGSEGSVTWETWRNARNDAPASAFPEDGSDPGPWIGPVESAARTLASFDLEPRQQLERPEFSVEFDHHAAEDSINETRLNRATYEFVVGNGLYNLDGQIALAKTGARAIVFPALAKEVKAQWREIEPADKPRYHWTEVSMPDGPKLYGLTALHITTKDLPNWFWATFEHIDNKLSQADGGRSGNEGWLLESIDRFTCPKSPVDCNRAPDVAPIRGTRWTNYVLRGTQIDFIESTGEPTLLANSQPEQGFQSTSSCMTCHARASVGADGRRLRVFTTLPDGRSGGHVGPPDPSWFREPGTGGVRFTQLDFVWSLFRAQPAR